MIKTIILTVALFATMAAAPQKLNADEVVVRTGSAHENYNWNHEYWHHHRYGYWNGQHGYWHVVHGEHVFVVH